MRRALLSFALVACANAGPSTDDGGDDAPRLGTDSTVPPGGCGPSDLAKDIDANGLVTCAAVEPVAAAAIDSSCSVYLGFRDGCDGCTTPPAKWGRASGQMCMNGAGAANTCTTHNLGTEPIQLFGLNTDGDVDGNDKLYSTLHCSAPASNTPTPCQPGSFVSGTATCSSFAVAAAEYVRTNCQLYAGWQDGCDGCTNPPGKWGRSATSFCQNGAGGDNTCQTVMLDAQVSLFGLNPDGDVDGNDKLHIGLRCTTPAHEVSSTTTTCPPGQFVTGVLPEGGVQCESRAQLVIQYFSDHCSVFYGWSDNCSGCLNPPSKWGQARAGACMNGAGGDNTCTSFTLGGQPVYMFGLNPDGDVDDNDTLYIGFKCR